MTRTLLITAVLLGWPSFACPWGQQGWVYRQLQSAASITIAFTCKSGHHKILHYYQIFTQTVYTKQRANLALYIISC